MSGLLVAFVHAGERKLFNALHYNVRIRPRVKVQKLNLRSMISLLRAVIEKVKFFFAVSSFLISMQPVLTMDSELAAVALTLPMRSIS